MKKHFICKLIIIILISSFFGGCSQKGKGSEKNIKTIKFATFYPEKEQGGIYKEIGKEFEKENKDIKIEITTDFGNEEKVKEAVSQKSDYDIIGVKRNQLIEFAKSGFVSEMSNTIEQNRLDKDLYKICLAYGSYNGKTYGIGDMPMSIEYFYNSEIFKRNKLKEPTNLKKLIDVCKKLKSKKIIPIGVGAIDGWTLASFLGMITAQTTGINELTSYYGSDSNSFGKISSMNTAFNIFGKLSGSCILKNSDEINYKQSVQDFVNGKTGILPAGSWAVELIDSIKPSGFNYKVFQNGVALTNNPISMYSASGGQILTMPSSSKNSKEVNKFIKFLFSEKIQKKFTEKGYTSSLISANTPQSDVKKQIINHIEAADSNSIMLMDNLEPTMLESMTMVLKDVLQGRIKPNEAWSRVLKFTFER